MADGLFIGLVVFGRLVGGSGSGSRAIAAAATTTEQHALVIRWGGGG